MLVGGALNLHEHEGGEGEAVLVSELDGVKLVFVAGAESFVHSEEAVEVLNGVLLAGHAFETDVG